MCFRSVRFMGVLCVVFLLVLIGGCGRKVNPDAGQGATVSQEKSAAPQKGPGRVAVEHGLDVDANKVDQTPREVTIEDLLATRDKGTSNIDLAAYHSRRVTPFETTTFEVKGTIKGIKHEKDGDFYFVVQGKTGKEAVIEVPDPALCKGSPLLPGIIEARKDLEARYHPNADYKELDEPITVDGVGFLGSRRKPGSGTFGSSVRLMPGTGVKFGG